MPRATPAAVRAKRAMRGWRELVRGSLVSFDVIVLLLLGMDVVEFGGEVGV